MDTSGADQLGLHPLQPGPEGAVGAGRVGLQGDVEDHGGGHAAGRRDQAREGQEEEVQEHSNKERGQEAQEGGDEMEGTMVRPGGQRNTREGFERGFSQAGKQ